MELYRQKFQDFAEQLRGEIAAIDRIFAVGSHEILTLNVKQRMEELRAGAEALLRKLETGEFEIAIVGLEKAGKSTFSNALIGNDILPTAESRCTYTTTSLRGGENEATVKFFSRDAFNQDFQEKLHSMEVPGWETLNFFDMSLEEYRRIFQALPERTRRAFHDQNLDMEAILTQENKKILEAHLGGEPLFFSGEEQLRSPEFKRYISQPGYAHAVQEATLRSSRLKDMPEAVIYDVPGLDSPTQIHKDQTLRKMKSADAIVLIAGADKPSFTGPLVEILDQTGRETDQDGLRLRDKLFVFANRADLAGNLAENMETIREELRSRVGMEPEKLSVRLLYGSALAHLENRGGSNDGIEAVHHKLKEYYDNERFHVLKSRGDHLRRDLEAVFRELLEEETEPLFSGGQENIVTQTLDQARDRLRASLEARRRELIEQYSNPGSALTVGMIQAVTRNMDPERLAVKPEDLETAEKKKYTVSHVVELTSAIEEYLREKKSAEIYDEFHRSMLTFAVEEHEKEEEKLIQIMTRSLGVTENGTDGFLQLREAVRDYVDRRKAGRVRDGSYESYYDSLVSRFTMDLFELLLRFPFGEDVRWEKWDAEKQIFFSLAMFDPEMNPKKTPDCQSFHYLLLFHSRDPKLSSLKFQEAMEQVKKYVLDFIGSQVLSRDTLDMIRKLVLSDPEGAYTILRQKLENSGQSQAKSSSWLAASRNELPSERLNRVNSTLTDLTRGAAEKEMFLDVETYRMLFQKRPPKTKESVREEINEDIRILHQVLTETAVYAICLEKPFLDLELRTIHNLLLSLGEDFRVFVKDHIRLIVPEQYHSLDEKQRRSMNRNRIRAEIKEALSGAPLLADA